MRLQRGAADQRAGARANADLALDALVFGSQRFARRPAVLAVDIAVDDRLIGAAQPDRGRYDRLQHRFEIKHRAADHAEHIADRGLVVERGLQILGALTQFAQQPGVLHRDHRLIGKGAHELDLPFGERLDPVAREHDDADRLTLAQ